MNGPLDFVDERGRAGVRDVAFNSLGLSAVVLDGDGVIIDTNEAWRLFTSVNDGSPMECGAGANYLEVCDRAAASGDADAAACAAGLRQVLGGTRHRFDFEYRSSSPTEDNWFVMQASAAPVCDGAGAVVVHLDVTARRALADRMSVLADDDALTGLPNRRSAERHLAEHWSDSRAARETMWLLFLDLDGFEALNERYGRHIGDEVLVKVAGRARRMLRATDRFCRWGGDEFVLIAPGLDRKSCTMLAHRLRTVMAAPILIGDVEVAIGVSVGIGSGCEHASVEALLGEAESTMHVDKQNATNRNRFRTARPSVAPNDMPLPSVHSVSEQVPSAPSSTGTAAAPSPEPTLSAAQARTEAALAHANDLVLFLGADGTIRTASPACLRIFGAAPEELLVDFLSIPNRGDSVRTEFRIVDTNGAIRWIEEVATNLVDDPDVASIVCNLRDVTERTELLLRIEMDGQRLADAQASAKLGSFEFDLATGAIHRSAGLCQMIGLDPDASPSLEYAFIHPDDRDDVRAVIARAVAGDDQNELTYRLLRTDGAVLWVRTQVARLSPQSNIVLGTVLDITDRHHAELALAHQASHDSLTRLPNASRLHETLNSYFSGPAAREFLAVAVVDVDHFKQFNDRGGHAAGDLLLHAVAVRLRSGVRASDCVARLGGDAFVVVRVDARTLTDAALFGEDIRLLFETPLVVENVDRRLSVSVGVALRTSDDSPTSLLRDADEAMDQAKRGGRDRVIVFDDEARSRAHRGQLLATILPIALELQEFHVEYQPILDLTTQEVAGFEALLRWEHPQLGPISPAEFIPIAEANGLIVPLGICVLERAVLQLSEWRARADVSADLWMSINVSASQLTDRGFVDTVRRVLERHGVPPSTVHLEITESVLIDGVEHALETIGELRSIGTRISIDDFGTGYSSFSYLSRMPVDTIKIDGSFVRDLGTSSRARTIVETMINLAASLKLDVVAEGVERPEQMHQLQMLGCRLGQGFIWSPSLKPDATLPWLNSRARRSALLEAID